MGDVRANQTGEAHIVVGEIQDENGNYLTVKTAFAAPSTSGDQQVVAAVTSKKLRVLHYALQATGTVNAKFTDDTPADLTPVWQFQAREGIALTAPSGAYLFQTASGKKLQLNLSASVGINVMVAYVEVP